MKKIPSLFVRNWDGDPRLVTRERNPECEWVFAGEGKPTRKFDGTSCLVRDGKLYKRYDRKKIRKGAKKGQWRPAPDGWVEVQEPDEKGGHWFGWVPVDFKDPNNRWHKEAWEALEAPLEDGTYELCGPKVNGNPEHLSRHTFIKHGSEVLDFEGRTYEEIEAFLRVADIEGIVWHHPDGRMAKIKKIDFGIPWGNQ
ncbi:MAG: RNA ligase 1 family protein [Promethearchaeota archaeon]